MSELMTPEDDVVELLTFEGPPGEATPAQRLKVVNSSDTAWTRVRLAAVLSPNTLTEDETPNFDPNLQGKEAMNERWVQVRCLGVNVDVEMPSPSEEDSAYQPIGGAYGIEDEGGEEGPDNFLPLPDLDPGDYALVEVRALPPETMDTERQTVLAFLVSFKGDMS